MDQTPTDGVMSSDQSGLWYMTVSILIVLAGVIVASIITSYRNEYLAAQDAEQRRAVHEATQQKYAYQNAYGTAEQGSGVKTPWRLVSGNVQDTCSHPRFEGEVVVRGWYEVGPAYGDGVEEALHVYPQDVSLLPGDQLGINYTNKAYVRLENASPALVETLRAANSNQPASVTLVEFGQYCEGTPMAKVPPPPAASRQPTHMFIDKLPATLSVVVGDSVEAHWNPCGDDREAVFKITAIENGKVYWEGEGSKSGVISGSARSNVGGLLVSAKSVTTTGAVLSVISGILICED